MQNGFIKIIQFILKPLTELLKAVTLLLNTIVDVVAVFPATLFASFSNRLTHFAASVDSFADTKKDARIKKKQEDALNEAFSKLMLCDDLLTHAQTSSRIKSVLIFLLELVSFPTTYRGLLQVFSTLGSWIPLLLAIVIQTGLAFLSNGAFSHYSPKSHRLLLIIFLTLSVSFSYLGTSESMLNYEEYLRQSYDNFKTAWEISLSEATEHIGDSGNPTSEVLAQRTVAMVIVEEALTDSSAEVITQLSAQEQDLRSRTVWVEVRGNTYPIYDNSGNIIAAGGGKTSRVEESDPDSIAAADELVLEIQRLRQLNDDATQLEIRLNDQFTEDHLLSILNNQLDQKEATAEFTSLVSDWNVFAAKINQLASDTGSSLQVGLDLGSLLQNYQSYTSIKEVEHMPDFSQLANDEESSLDLAFADSDYIQAFLAPFVRKVPLTMMESVTTTVEESYKALKLALQGLDSQAEVTLDNAYESFNVEHPFSYFLSPLLFKSDNKLLAILSLLMALAVDGTAVLIGAFFEHRKANWFSRKSFTRSQVAAYGYDQLRAVVLPIITRRLDHQPVTRCNIYTVFGEFIREFLDKFQLCHSLKSEGFSRYAESRNFRDSDCQDLLAFLLSVGMAEVISADEAVELDVLKAHTTADDIVLLSIRADSLFRDMLANACDIKTQHDPAAINA